MINGVRAIALAIFGAPERFLTSNIDCLGNFDLAKDVIFDELERCHSGDLREAISVAGDEAESVLAGMSSWHDFFRAFCGHGYLSRSETSLDGFAKLWQQIWGFDIDGLLEVGDPDAISVRRNKKFLPRHSLAELAKSHWLSDLQELRDEHLHFGQFVDSSLLWLVQIKSLSCEFGNRFQNYSRDSGFGASQRRANEMAIHGSQERILWDKRLAQCRFLFCIFLSDGDRIERFSSFLREHTTDEELLKLEGSSRVEQASLAEKNLQNVIDLERRMFSLVGDSFASEIGSVEYRIALAYTIIKNAAFHGLLSNTVRDFKGFSRSLAVLDHVYRRVRVDVRDVMVLDVFREHLSFSESMPAEVRLLIRPGALKLSMDVFHEQIRAVRVMLHALENGRVSLAFHRDDFERFSAQDWLAVKQRVLDLVDHWDLQLAGIDLVGSEVRMSAASADRDSGGTSSQHLLSSLDFVFDLRDSLEVKLSRRDVFVSFHCGEHVQSDVLGLFGILAVLADNRFRKVCDRISHALVLHCDIGDDGSSEAPYVLDALVGRLLCDEGVWNNGVFDSDFTNRAKELILEFQASRDASRLNSIRFLLMDLFSSGEVILEICPLSNQMIRGRDLNISASRHSWKSAYGKKNVLVGTDDPSLTLSLPWIEHVLLRASV